MSDEKLKTCPLCEGQGGWYRQCGFDEWDAEPCEFCETLGKINISELSSNKKQFLKKHYPSVLATENCNYKDVEK